MGKKIITGRRSAVTTAASSSKLLLFTSGFRLFSLPEELIELVLDHCSSHSLDNFHAVCGDIPVYLRSRYKRFRVSASFVSDSTLYRRVSVFGRYVRYLCLLDMSKCPDLDVAAVFSNVKTLEVYVASCPHVVISEHLGKMRHLRRVILHPFNTLASKYRALVNWINDPTRSGHVQDIVWLDRSYSSDEYVITCKVMNMIHDLHRIQLVLALPYEEVNSPVEPQFIPMLTKLLLWGGYRRRCVVAKLGAVIGAAQQMTIYPCLRELQLSVCCRNTETFDFTSIAPARFPSLEKMDLTVSDMGCGNIAKYGYATDDIFSIRWPSITQLALRMSYMRLEPVVEILKALPNLTSLHLQVSSASSSVNVADIVPYLLRASDLCIAAVNFNYSPISTSTSTSTHSLTNGSRLRQYPPLQPLQLAQRLGSTSVSQCLRSVKFVGSYRVAATLQFVMDTPGIRVVKYSNCYWKPSDLKGVHPSLLSTVWVLSVEYEGQKSSTAEAFFALVSLFPNLTTIHIPGYSQDVITKLQSMYPRIEVYNVQIL
ncbi:hypothetical protein GQ42DRAFT_162398 [Ramicandelaber brevisporus]|nr:hypothetical protein GQ42DRAFT_162398 [Ramicandelaber brevisporus]